MNYTYGAPPRIARLAWTVGLLMLAITVALLSILISFGGGLAITLTTVTIGIYALALLGLALLISIETLLDTDRHRLRRCFAVASGWAFGLSVFVGIALYMTLSNDPLAGFSGPILIVSAAASVWFGTLGVYVATRWRTRPT